MPACCRTLFGSVRWRSVSVKRAAWGERCIEIHLPQYARKGEYGRSQNWLKCALPSPNLRERKRVFENFLFPLIGGGAHKGWDVRFNRTQHRESYQGRRQDEGQAEDLTRSSREFLGLTLETGKGSAWPSSSR
jgi:hypothetical protein